MIKSLRHLALLLCLSVAPLALAREEVADVLADRTLDMKRPADRAKAVARMKVIEDRRLQNAHARGRALGIPLSEILPNGGWRELVDFDAEGPVFRSSRNTNAAISTGANLTWSSPHNLNGSGLIVGVWDSGMGRTTHQEFATGSRLVSIDGSTMSAHSMHVAGTIGALGVSASSRGMANAAKVHSYTNGNDYSEMTAAGATATGQTATKIHTSNHSYGPDDGWRYNSSTSKWVFGGTGTDQNAYDINFGQYSSNSVNIDSTIYNTPYLASFWACGNDRTDGPGNGNTATVGGVDVTYNSAIHPLGDGVYRSGYETINAESIGKNTIAIGAVNDAVTSGVRDISKATISSFSSTGPADDGRIKPDLVANGVSLTSTGIGSDTETVAMNGTSMATPNACGSATLLVDQYNRLFSSSMRASTLKALLIHTADDIGNPGPDYFFGWGLINVKKGADLVASHAANPTAGQITESNVSTTTTSREYPFIWDGVSPITATIAWTDPAATTVTAHDSRTPVLVNNLNLKVIAPNGAEFFPYIMPFVGTWTVASMSQNATTGVNNVDNVEHVRIATPGQAGIWRAQVGYTGTITNTTQDFGLILSGLSNDKTLVVNLAASSVSETAGNGATTGTVSRIGTSGDLVVSLASGNTSKITVPASITIPNGQTTSPPFNLNAVDNLVIESTQTVAITASASGHLNGTANINITDNDNNLPVVNAGTDQTISLTANTWSPLQLAPKLWLDADDTNSITLNGVTVSQWADKSGFNRHATATDTAQPTATATGLNGKRVITFDGATDVLNVDLDFFSSVSHSAFIVTKPTIYSNIYGAATSGSGANSLHVGFSSASNYRMNFWGNDYAPAVTGNFVAGSANIMNYVWTAGTSKQILANGKSEGISTSPVPGTIGTMSGGGRIGRTTGHAFFGGDIAELIAITGAVSATDREKMEGYLAHKWGLTARLDAAHPYKATSPSGGQAIASLDGTVSDADGHSLTTTWTMVSGPAGVALGNSGAIDTTASFTAAGTYTLRLTANDGFTQVSDDVVITVNPPAATYTVTFDANGGNTPSPTTKSVTYGATYGTLATVTRTGHTFNGWFTATSGGTEVTSSTTVAITAAQTLYAQWTPNSNTYTVTFDANGGNTPSPTTKSVTSGSTYGSLATVARTGHTFNGWFTATSGGNQVTSSTAVTIIAPQTLYARWTATSNFALAAPDLTGPGVIAALKIDSNATPVYGDTYNLGATGLRGWIWIDRSNQGDVGLITDSSRQILVTHCDAPANAVLAVDDVILGAIAASSGTVPDFTSDCRKAFGTAIGDAEKTGAGTLRVKRWRAGVTSEHNITLPILGNYNTTAPFNSCPKSALILDNVRNKMVADLIANSNYLTGGFGGSSNALALLSGVKPGDPNYDTVQTRLQTYARSLASAGPVNDGLPIWKWSYDLIFLAEYYLLTSDAQVVSGIQEYTLTLAEAQSIYGTYGHGPSAFRTDGSGRRVSTGYGPVNAVGGTAMIALALGKKALVAAGQAIAPEIDAAIDRSAGFFAFYVNKGSVPYGEHEPVANNHGSNGKDAMPAVFFSLLPNRAVETEYFSRISLAGWIGREYGHTGQGLSYYWTALGALMGGPDAASEHLKQVRWHLDLSRRTDGSFAYDGQEQYGPGTTSGNTYLGAADYGGMSSNAMYLLTYSMPLQRLWITGKNANPAYTLDSTKIADSVAAGSFQIQRVSKTVSELFTALGAYHPVVRNHASIELASRTPTGADLTNLRNLLSNPDPNLRGSACQTLGLLQDSTSLPTIVTLLNDPDIWVRAKAAVAIRAYPSATASTHRDAMMTSFISNATDPDIIDWNDPIQMGNGKLSMAVFGHGVNDGTPGNDIAAYTINAPKQSLLYPALRAGLRQPDSYVRTGATKFCKDRLPLPDTQAVYPSVAHAAAYDTPADRMWSNDSRSDAITLLANLNISDGIDLAVSMLDIPDDFAWGSQTSKIAALNGLALYGDSARYTLPTLKSYLNQWSPVSSEYVVLVSTISTIENAITAPAQPPGLCVANSQVVTTTGSTAITLSGSSPRGSTFTYLNVTQPAHGTITGTAPNLTYTPTGGYTGPDSFTFQTTDTLTTSTVATVGIIMGASGNGLQGEYFNNSDFTNPVPPRIDPQVNFDWGTGSPDPSIGADTFSVRWSGVLLVPQSGNYTFSSLTSDGVRLYINGNLVIDRFVDQSTRWTDSSPVYLTKGQYADIYMEYYENTGSAVAKLKWTGPGFAGANGNFIPQAYLFDGSTISNRPVYAFPQNLTTNLNTALPVSLSGTGGTLTYTVLTQPANGTLSGTVPNLTYTPNSNFSGTDSFTFLVNNGSKNSLPATVSINVQAGPLTSFTWASAVSGNWSDGTKWTPSLPAAAGLPTYALNFTAPGTYTATHNLNNGFQLNQLNAAANVTLVGTQGLAFASNGGSLPQFNQNSANEVRVDHPVSLQSTTTLAGSGGGKVILNGVISGNGGLVKNNAGILQIGQLTNSYSGGTVLNAGTVEPPTGDGNLTPILGSGSITFNQGATLFVNRTNLANNMIFNGGTVTGGNSFSSVFSGSITLNGIVTFDFGTTGGFGITGNISGPGGFTYTGPFNAWSEFPCSGTNTHTGPTTVLSGTLSFPSINSVPPGPMILSDDSKLKLNFTGTRVIESFTLNGSLMPPGTYGSTTSPASNKNDTYFTGNGTLTVLQPTTTALTLTSGTSPANPGTSLTFTATVTGSTPTGNVQFYSDTTLLGTSALNGSYQAAFTTTQLAIGSNSVTARYMGNASNSPSTSSPVVVEINNATVGAPSGLTASPASPNINLNWTATPGASSYYVKRSTTSGGPYTVRALVTGTTWQDSTPVEGVSYHYVVSALNSAGESADSNQATANIGSLTATTTTLAAFPVATQVYGSSVTLTATVTATNGTPTGTVTFRSGSNVIGTAALSSGTASLVISTLAATTHSITASYAGSLDSSASSALSYQITPKPLTLTGVAAANKIYDGTTAATLSGGSLGGVVGGDTVTIVPGTGTFASANVGTWAVTAAGFSLGGTHADNYTLSAQPTVPNATITARPIHITGAKTYDATTSAPNSILTIANNVDGENLSLVGNAELSAKDAGNRTILTGSTPARVQFATGNTGASAATSFTATMNTRPVSGNTLIAVIVTRGNSANRISGITQTGVTWTKAAGAEGVNTNATSGSTTEIWHGSGISAGAGTVATINCAASLFASAVIAEYSRVSNSSALDQTANASGNSATASTGTTLNTTEASELWIGGIGLRDSTYSLGTPSNSFTTVSSANSTNGTANSNAKAFFLERIVTSTGAAVSSATITSSRWSGAIATFKTAQSLSLTGSAAANYTLTGMTSLVTVNPKSLTLTGLSASDKTYDGTTVATVSGTGTLLAAQAPGAGTTSDGIPYTGDTITLGGTPTGGSFATKHVGIAKSVTGVTGLTLSGAQAGNYALVPVSTLAANVTQLAVTVAAVTATKTYDKTTSSSGTPAITPALASGDNTTVLAQSYQSASAGDSNKTLIPSITINDGNGGANYAVTLSNFTTGTITPLAVTVAAVNATKTYDGTTTASGTPTITPPLVSGDTTNSLAQSFDTPTAGTNNKIIVPSITINDGNSGNNYAVTLTNFTTGTINKAAASVTLGSLSQTFTNSPKSVSVTTSPPGLTSAVTYDGSASEPINAGTYAVVATVNDINYTGSAAGSLVIDKANQTITFAALNPVLDNSAPFALAASASSNLPVSYSSSNTLAATVSGNTVTIVGIGSTTITASQAGDTNYNPATSVPQSLTVGRANPLAVAGGPYSVLVGQSITLNGGASEPSYGATLNDYEWDLNNDNTFGDVTGASPAISYATLVSSWAMAPGPNTIRLRVRDSANLTSQAVSATLTLIASLTWDANGSTASQTDGAGIWLAANQWWTGSNNTTWSSGASALFGNGGAGGAVTLASPATVNSFTFNTFTGTYSLGTTGQAITLNSGITMNATAGAATISSPLTLGGPQTWTNYSTSTLTISGALSNGGHTLTVDGSGIVNFTTALAAGAGGITKNGSGRLQLNNATQGYTGPTIVNGGVLSYGDNSSQLSAANITLNGGVIDQRWNSIFTRALGSGGNQIQLTGGASGFSNNNGGHTVRINNNTATEVVWGAANEAGNVNATGYFNPSILVLQSAYTQNNQNVVIDNPYDLNATTRTIQVNPGIGGASVATFSRVIRTSTGTAGITKTGGGILALNAANTYNGGTTLQAGTLQLGNASGLGSASSQLTVNAGLLNLNGQTDVTVGNLTGTGGTIANNASNARTFFIGSGNGTGGDFQGIITDKTSGTGSIALTKIGSGTITLSGANSYTGLTAISAGKLFINGDQSLAAGNITVSPNATLGGSGTIGGNTTIAADGKLEFNLSTAPASHDKLELAASRTLNFSGASTLTIISTGGAEPGTYTLITAPGGITGTLPTLSPPANWSAALAINGNNLELIVASTVLTPGSLTVTAAGGFSSSGSIGGPFSPDSVVYTLSNSGQTSVNWTAANNVAWVDLSAISGTLAAGASTTVTVSINATANSLAMGSYSDTVTFTNTTNNTGNTTRGVALTVLSPYQGWANGFLPADVSNPAGNNDGDALTNLQEYAFGTDPTASSSGPIIYTPGGDVTTPGAPAPINLAVGGGVDYRAVFGRRKNHVAAGLTYTVQFSADFTTWVSSTATPTVLTGANSSVGVEAVSVPYPFFILTASGYKKPTFFRVAVSSN